MVDHVAISTPQTMVAFAPIDAPRPTTVGITSQSVAAARGYRSFVNTAPGPTNTSSSIVTPLYTDTLFWILQPEPIRTPASMNTFLPMTHRAPTDEPSRTCA